MIDPSPIHAPTLVDSATILAAVAALIALPVAWRSYKDDERRSRDALVDGVRNVLTGLGPEMELVRHWAESPSGEGYPPHGDDVETYRYYRQNKFDWLNPRFELAPIVCPAIESLPLSRYAAQVGPLIQPFGLLNSALATLAKAESGRLAFVAQSSGMMIQMRRLWNEPNQKPTREELDFIESVFFHNFEIYVQVIGSAQSPQENTLFRAYRSARTALDQFMKEWEQSLTPPIWWHGIADASALMMLAAAGAIFFLWFWKAIDPLPQLAWELIRNATCTGRS